MLQDRPKSAQELAREMAEDFDADADEEILERVEAVLATLDGLGLIEPLPS